MSGRRWLYFLAEVMGKPQLHTMADPLARANVMAYRAGDALNWHFDRSEFTTTLLLQAPDAGGDFQYRRDLRSDERSQLRRRGHVDPRQGSGRQDRAVDRRYAQCLQGQEHALIA